MVSQNKFQITFKFYIFVDMSANNYLIPNNDSGMPDEYTVKQQLERFAEGFPFMDIVESAAVGNGIRRLDTERIDSLGRAYDAAAEHLDILKFVPASGAATRMFADLYRCVDEGAESDTVRIVRDSLGAFAFYEALQRVCGNVANKPIPEVMSAIISPDGLDYGRLPKALILFHRYGDTSRTPLEEHLVEGAQYARSGNTVRIHFTVSPQHIEGFSELLDSVLPVYSERYGVHYDIALSTQRNSTDTVAVNPDNTPFREPDGSLLFRPAGHGALIQNLNDINADIIFIKNIDNVTVDALRHDTVVYKKAMAGLLLEVRQQIFDWLQRLDDAEPEVVCGVVRFLQETLSVALPESFDNLPDNDKITVLRRLLDRPLRVCGMVRNQGEPGGGPFFVRDREGIVSLQIVEASQIAPEYKHLMASSTHFNPVDVVCSVRDRFGAKYDLTKYIDPNTGFISQKTKNGRPLKALELPGLWNGAMSDWNTVFVEVPVTTFTPVKTVTDLLREGHRQP